ncbi:MAG: histidine kinase, partial [Saprospiraceae bacterium]|nr:histidine kinase [Saprospiraceae bacterium]
MSKTLDKNLQSNLYSLLSRRMVYHGLFWLGLFLFLMYLDQTQQTLASKASIEMINLVFYAGIVYFNLFYLIPRFLSEKKFIRYSLLLFLTALAITPIKMLVLYFIFDGQGQAQAQLIQDQPIYFLSSFLIAGGSTVLKVFSDWVRYQRDRQILQT